MVFVHTVHMRLASIALLVSCAGTITTTRNDRREPTDAERRENLDRHRAEHRAERLKQADKHDREQQEFAEAKERERVRKETAAREREEQEQAEKQSAAEEEQRRASREREAAVAKASMDAYDNGEEGIIKRACDAKAQLDDANDIIAREKRIGKTAGYVNAAVLRNAAAQKIEAEDELAQLRAEYKRATSGKAMKLTAKLCAEQ